MRAILTRGEGSAAIGPGARVHAVARQAAAANALVHETLDVGLGASDTVSLHAKVLRLELLRLKADLERELGQLVLDCASYGRRVHWVAGLGVTAGHWAHREPAPHHEPTM